MEICNHTLLRIFVNIFILSVIIPLFSVENSIMQRKPCSGLQILAASNLDPSHFWAATVDPINIHWMCI